MDSNGLERFRQSWNRSLHLNALRVDVWSHFLRQTGTHFAGKCLVGFDDQGTTAFAALSGMGVRNMNRLAITMVSARK